jgi:phosphatidylglycerophosphatase C
VRGTPRVLVAAVRAIPQVRDRDAYKLTLIAQLFRGEREDRLAALGEAYVASLEAGLRPELLDRLRWHQAEGHATVLVSASLGAYLRPLAERLGLDAALAVELVVGADGRLTGEVVGGLNTRGPEKVSRLRAWLAERHGPDAEVELWAYGDSSGDEQLLALADHPTWVGKRATRAGVRPAGDGG